MKKNLLLLLMALLFGTSASVYAAQVGSKNAGNTATEATLGSDIGYTYYMWAKEGASITVAVKAKYAFLDTGWMEVSYDGNSMRFSLDYDQWVYVGKPSTYEGIYYGWDDKRYTIMITLTEFGNIDKPIISPPYL